MNDREECNWLRFLIFLGCVSQFPEHLLIFGFPRRIPISFNAILPHPKAVVHHLKSLWDLADRLSCIKI